MKCCFGRSGDRSPSPPIVRNVSRSQGSINGQPKIKNNAKMGRRGIDIVTNGDDIEDVLFDPNIYGRFTVSVGPLRPLEPTPSASPSPSPPPPRS